jgi:hypothetical protein
MKNKIVNKTKKNVHRLKKEQKILLVKNKLETEHPFQIKK